MKSKIKLNDCMTKTIGGVRYTVRSFFAQDGEGKDFRALYESIVASKFLKTMEQFKDHHWDNLENSPYYTAYAVRHEDIVFIEELNLPKVNYAKTFPDIGLYPAILHFFDGPFRPRVQWRR